MQDVVEQVTSDARGIIDPVTHRARIDHQRHEPSPHVRRFVAWYAVMRWNLGDDRHTPVVLGHPVVNLVFEPHEANVTGVVTGRFTRVLAGQSWALGVMFRPAGFKPLSNGPLSRLTGRRQPAPLVLGDGVGDLHAEVVATSSWDDRLARVEAYLDERLPQEHQACEDTTAIVERIAADRSLLRVDQVAAEFGTGVRRLQRAFSDHVGVSPKWVIQRYRLYDAAETAARGGEVDWSALAVELGYSDQAHLVRSFTAAVGMPPDRYARSVGRSRQALKD